MPKKSKKQPSQKSKKSDSKKKRPKKYEKPLSLSGMTFDEAMEKLVQAKPLE